MNLQVPAVEFDSTLIQKYDRSLPRYTSYPPATELKETFSSADYAAAIAAGNAKRTPLSLYCHIPFCETACYFCGCNTVITQRKEVAEPYLNYLIRSIRQTARLVDGDRTVNQMHWGGGTPNYLAPEQIETLWRALRRSFNFDENAEISIEVNPRSLDRNYIFFLKELGFNHISFGIQDFNPQVQAAVNRIQPEAMLFEAMEWIRSAGFESVNVDLIYGLPFQTLEAFTDTIRKTVQLDPDRIAVFNFAYMPWLKPVQRHIPAQALPQPAEKLDILKMAIEQLETSNYVFIGMDHFAKPNDELAVAQREGKLHRNFQGYTTKPESDLLGFGMTSISMLQNVYVQNHKRLKEFYQAVDAGILPIERGVRLSSEDLLRRAIIMELMCQFQLSGDEFAEKYQVALNQNFDDYFAKELLELKRLEADGLIHIAPNQIEVTPAGRLLIRNVAAVFDTYLGDRPAETFSKAL